MRKRCSAFVLIVSVLLVVSGVVPASPSANQSDASAPAAAITISGKAVNSQGGPVEGAKVMLYQMIYAEGASSPKPEMVDEKSTAADGAFTLVIPQGVDPKKTSYIVARKEGLALGWTAWRLQGEQRLEITLGEPKDLAGEIVDEKGQPVADAEVRIAAIMMGKGESRRYLTPPSFLIVRTDRQGRFLFAGMPAEATFEFHAEKPGRAAIGTLERTMYVRDRYQFSPGQAGIKLVLPLEARIEGVVVDKTGGKPVGGVQVIALSSARAGMLLSPKLATTAQDGIFQIGGLNVGSYTVQLPTSSEKMSEWAAEPVPVSVRAGETKSGIKLELTKGGIIEVLVREAGGKTIAKVNVGARHALRDQYFGANTDENGLARVRVTPGEYRISGPYKEGYSRGQNEETVSVADGQTQHVEFVLSTLPKITGIVRDEAGNPLAGVQVAVMPMGRSETTTDASGKFEVAWDPTPFPSAQNLTVVLVARDVARNLAGSTDLDEQAGNLDIKLQPGVTVTGTVVNEEGKPLPGTGIRIMLNGPRWRASFRMKEIITTGPDGVFEIKTLAPDREYTITATADGYGRQNISVNTSGLKENRHDAGQLKLPLANLSVTGIVVDANDQPIAGANVRASYDGGEPYSNEAQTDTDGKFIIKGLSPGMIRLMADSGRLTRAFGSARVESGTTDVRIVVSARGSVQSYMPRRPVSLRGKPLPPWKDLGIDLPADAADKMLLVCFWDMGQRPSRYCLTQLAAQAGLLGEKGVRIVAIQAAKVEDNTLKEWVEKNKVPFPVGNITGDVDKTQLTWGVASLPHLILTDKKHAVVAEGFNLSDLDKQIETAGR